jgi:hypothetical protein
MLILLQRAQSALDTLIACAATQRRPEMNFV